jgi:hypothetical protein
MIDFKLHNLPLWFGINSGLNWPAWARYYLALCSVFLMKFSLSTSALALTSIIVPALGATYMQSDSIVGAEFLNAFTFEAEGDLTNGHV